MARFGAGFDGPCVERLSGDVNLAPADRLALGLGGIPQNGEAQPMAKMPGCFGTREDRSKSSFLGKVREVTCYGYLTVSCSSMTTDWQCSDFLYAHSDRMVRLRSSIMLKPHTAVPGGYG